MKKMCEYVYELKYKPCQLKIWGSTSQEAIEEPSLVAWDEETGKLEAIGSDAEQCRGRVGMVISSPFKDGIVANFLMARVLFRYFIHKVYTKKLVKPKVLICVPGEPTEIERRAFEEAILMAGAKQCTIMLDHMDTMTCSNWKDNYDVLIGIASQEMKEGQ